MMIQTGDKSREKMRPQEERTCFRRWTAESQMLTAAGINNFAVK